MELQLKEREWIYQVNKEDMRQLAARQKGCFLSSDSELGDFTKDLEPC